MTIRPLVSIVIPVYNGSNYLAKAIDSALDQSYENFEVLVINDGSDDEGETEKIALSYNDKIKYFSKPNGGVASALNFGIHKMSGEYFSWLSHDDLYHRDKIKQQIRYLQSLDDKKTVVYSDFALYFQETDRKQDIRVSEMHFNYSTNILLQLFVSAINGCTLLIPHNLFDQLGLFNEKLKTTQDYEYWFTLVNNGVKFAHLNECLVISRQHKEQDIHKINDIHHKELDELYERAFLLMRDQYFSRMTEMDLNLFLGIEKSRNLHKTYEEIRNFRDSMIEATPFLLRILRLGKAKLAYELHKYFRAQHR